MTDEYIRKLGERVTTLEANQEHIVKTVDEMSDKVDAVHNVLMKASGARWAILAIGGVIGFCARELPGCLCLKKNVALVSGSTR